jgi:DNA-binding response OmpR family regulator
MPAWILVCDDEAHIRHIIAHKLRAAGFSVVEARNGEEALSLLDAQIAKEGSPSLVISDFQMPLITGLELCKVLKQRAATAGTPALMLTARGYVLTDEELAQTNIREVISKPFGVRQLLERVVKMLGEPEAGRSPGSHYNTPGGRGANSAAA